jgi:hypothetical protein
MACDVGDAQLYLRIESASNNNTSYMIDWDHVNSVRDVRTA